MSDPKIHAAVPRYNRDGWEALCRHINHPRLTDRRREVTCQPCRAKLDRRPRRWWRPRRV